MLAQANVPVLRGVENMAPFRCGPVATPSSCSHRRLTSVRFGLLASPLPLASIPFTVQLAQAAAEGRPSSTLTTVL